MRFQHFLVPLDCSTHADRALEYAIGLAIKCQARLTLLHVIELPKLIDMRLTPYREKMAAEFRRVLEACLKRVHNAGADRSAPCACG
jgi:nucleotide-binding universal stress UspA family protein